MPEPRKIIKYFHNTLTGLTSSVPSSSIARSLLAVPPSTISAHLLLCRLSKPLALGQQTQQAWRALYPSISLLCAGQAATSRCCAATLLPQLLAPTAAACTRAACRAAAAYVQVWPTLAFAAYNRHRSARSCSCSCSGLLSVSATKLKGGGGNGSCCHSVRP